MRNVLARLGVAALMVVCSVAEAGNGTTLKPYVTLVLDTSGSMSNATGSGPPSCGGTDTKLNHARCAINNIVNSYGDMVFAFGRFREVAGGTVSGTCPSGCSLSQNACTTNDDRFELMTSLVDGNNAEAAKWADFTCNTCTPNIPISAGQDPEVWNAAGNTPITGSLKGAERYYQGLQATIGHCSTTITQTCTTIGVNSGCPGTETCVATVMWPSSSSGFDPILNDPTNSVFLPRPGAGTQCNANAATCDNSVGCTGANCCCLSQCRPYIVIMLTDGDETCGGTTTVGTCSGSGATCYIDAQCPAGQTCTGAGTEGQAAAAMLYADVHAINLTSLIRASNVVTATTATAHTFVVGSTIVINGAADTSYNGMFTVTGVADNTHFTYAQTGTNGSTGASASRVFYAALNDPINISTITRAGNTVTVTTAAAHKIVATQDVVIAGVANASFNGTFKVATAPDTTHFTYTQTAADATSSGGTASHAAMLYQYRVETKPIGFGVAPGYTNIEYLAHAGGAVDNPAPGVYEGYYAADEAGLELAISTIVAKSLRSETCNNLDDDCDTKIDEDFPTKGATCSNGEKGVCQVNGTNVCRADGTGVTCDAGTAACNGQPDGTACSVTNSAGASVAGKCNAGVCDPFLVQGTNPEICNGLDDDCDGLIDEGANCCVPTQEICDGMDNDCDGQIDKSCRCSNNNNQICNPNVANACGAGNSCVCTPITRSCGQGTCVGVETCNYGADPSHYTGCTAPPACTGPGTGPDCGICDGQDNDCDGVCDGFTLGCSDIVTAGGPASDNPGDPSHSPIPQNQCHPGQKTCPQSCAGTNSFTACTGEVKPTAEICDGLDNDCDNIIDEDFVSQPCSSNCGTGMTVCMNGVVTCNAQIGTVDNTCNNVDDDCDGKIDEDWVCDSTPGCVGPNCCKCGTGTTCEQTKCINGTPTCVTNPPINVEVCNCLDDNCNGQVDEGTLCGAGADCVQCQCAYHCNPGEFPCPLGKKCVGASPNNYCVNDPCYGVTCPDVNGAKQVCHDNGDNTSQCVDACGPLGGVMCQSPLVCFPPTGDCRPDDCTTYPDRCTSTQNCVVNPNTGLGECVSNPCSGVTCPAEQYCEGGQCYKSCAGVDCPVGQRCRLGMCEADPCGHQCPYGKVCNDSTGVCVDDPCPARTCPQGQWCNPNDNQCEPDPCVGTTCPDPSQVCKGGTCYDPADFLPDGGMPVHVTVGGGGCSTTGHADAGLLLGALALLLRRRRRGAGGAS